MIFSNYVKICHTHSQSFEHCQASVITVVPKFVLSVTLVIIGRKVVTHREIYCSCVLGDLCCCVIKYSKCEIIVEALPLFTSVS